MFNKTNTPDSAGVFDVLGGCAALGFFSLSHAGSSVKLTETDPNKKTNYSLFFSKSTSVKLFFTNSSFYN